MLPQQQRFIYIIFGIYVVYIIFTGFFMLEKSMFGNIDFKNSSEYVYYWNNDTCHWMVCPDTISCCHLDRCDSGFKYKCVQDIKVSGGLK